MSLSDLGKNDISEETQALKDKLASRGWLDHQIAICNQADPAILDTENAGLRTQLMRRGAELEELRATLNDTVYKVGSPPLVV